MREDPLLKSLREDSTGVLEGSWQKQKNHQPPLESGRKEW